MAAAVVADAAMAVAAEVAVMAVAAEAALHMAVVLEVSM